MSRKRGRAGGMVKGEEKRKELRNKNERKMKQNGGKITLQLAVPTIVGKNKKGCSSNRRLRAAKWCS